ncbi:MULTISPECIES: ATP-grasp domain-containing protein [Streptomyces]|uniref:ATP-grasp domain-containing protein n=1 Tax=Streptomyces coelicolor (strain ATCC BAA-471 / A3(2) / M145) TaxID=100226 RepID=O88027_STRCO|nr:MULTISPECIES: ATP-grasp domain-containing protein [Streptomyces]MDX2928453.1 ATP-grasp domain-containing protein [Streptomyces sp. NRRL_B-16638]MDX3409460.1 ATP-grasp domain-containing protein [Streptomyces sp. ME02-6977A]MYU46174.1 ATP-grasp domain protein [Streptomyces sp. SID7813]NSL78410.1 ATP-grasp domain protein [Streptomyces coelicolor]QFI46460.1 ATP-grasp domain protein [Streptomyces coelicolor A3(2)]
MASPVRVWLNRTYAENVFFMDQLRRNPADRAVEIHATHGDPDSPVLAAADTAELEPEGLSPAGYVEYALAQCARRGIDVFVPRLHQSAIVAHRAEFEALGTALLAPPPEAVAVFRDKVIAYEAVRAIGVPVPPWWRVRTADELVLAVEELEAGGHRACFKPASGAGGVGFRMVTRDPFSLTHLNGFPSPSVPLPLVVEALRAAEEPVDWLVMPRLEQPEVSVDCLTGPDNRVRLAVGRTKNGRRRGFTLHDQWLTPARRIAETFGLHHLSNVQFRMYGDRPVLMDVNTRPAGGLHQLALCGVNVPWAAVRLALGDDPGQLEPPFLGQDYAVVSGPRPLRPVTLPHQRADLPAATTPAPAPAPAAAAAPAPAPAERAAAPASSAPVGLT